jgi:hypothetical protein
MRRRALLCALFVGLPGLARAQPGPGAARPFGAGNPVEALRQPAPRRPSSGQRRPRNQDIEVENDETHRAPRRAAPPR